MSELADRIERRISAIYVRVSVLPVQVSVGKTLSDVLDHDLIKAIAREAAAEAQAGREESDAA